jgi:hypothetical protein
MDQWIVFFEKYARTICSLLVNVYNITMERSTMLSMGKSTISTGPCSIAMLVYQKRTNGSCIFFKKNNPLIH